MILSGILAALLGIAILVPQIYSAWTAETLQKKRLDSSAKTRRNRTYNLPVGAFSGPLELYLLLSICFLIASVLYDDVPGALILLYFLWDLFLASDYASSDSAPSDLPLQTCLAFFAAIIINVLFVSDNYTENKGAYIPILILSVISIGYDILLFFSKKR